MYCTNCGAKNEDDAMFCTYCGTSLNNSKTDSDNVVPTSDINQNTVNTNHNTTNPNDEDFNNKYANMAFGISLALAIISLIIRIGYIWVALLCFMLFNFIKKGEKSKLAKKAKTAKIFTIIFIVLQVINYIYFFISLK